MVLLPILQFSKLLRSYSNKSSCYRDLYVDYCLPFVFEKFVAVDDFTYLFALYEDYFLLSCPHSDKGDP